MLFTFRRKEAPWEVVDNHSIEPVRMFTAKDDLQISRVGQIDTVGTYVFNTSRIRDGQELRRMLLFSRRLLLQEVSKRGFNILLIESWRLTIMRKGHLHRVEIRYRGRPARASGTPKRGGLPPFINMLDLHLNQLPI